MEKLDRDYVAVKIFVAMSHGLMAGRNVPMAVVEGSAAWAFDAADAFMSEHGKRAKAAKSDG